MRTKDDIRFVIPYVEFAKQTKGSRPLMLDTSAIVDGRIADLCESRFFDARVMVPRFVLNELQLIADSADKLKRNRGRRGLDMLNKMQASSVINVEIDDTNPAEVEEPRAWTRSCWHSPRPARADRHHRLQPDQGRTGPRRRRHQRQIWPTRSRWSRCPGRRCR